MTDSKLAAALLTQIPKPAWTGTAARAAQQRELLGTWLATATVSASRYDSDQPVGLVFHRVWKIWQTCTGGTCRLYVTRTTNGGPVSTWLVWSGDRWTARFDGTALCGGEDTTIVQYEDWTLQVRPGAIVGVEHDHMTGACHASTAVVQ